MELPKVLRNIIGEYLMPSKEHLKTIFEEVMCHIKYISYITLENFQILRPRFVKHYSKILEDYYGILDVDCEGKGGYKYELSHHYILDSDDDEYTIALHKPDDVGPLQDPSIPLTIHYMTYVFGVYGNFQDFK